MTVAETPYTRIQPPQRWRWLDLADLLRHQSLLLHLVRRDIQVLFSNTFLGVLWIVLQPLATVAVITVVLGLFAGVNARMPYPVLVLSGLVPWSYFSATVSKACYSMLANSSLFSKVYFPRLIIPIVPVLVGLVDMLVLTFVLLAVCMFYGIMPAATWLVIPLPLAINVGLALGCGLWLSAMNVRYRDIGNLLPVVLQVGLYATPVFYPLALVPLRWQAIYRLNPLVGVVELLRWSLFGGTFPAVAALVSVAFAAVSILGGIVVFHRIENTVADIV